MVDEGGDYCVVFSCCCRINLRDQLSIVLLQEVEEEEGREGAHCVCYCELIFFAFAFAFGPVLWV